jgi:hypothetical protein
LVDRRGGCNGGVMEGAQWSFAPRRVC